MSKEAATAFLKAIEDKPELKEQLRAQKLNERDSPENEQKLLDIATRAGYNFSIMELASAARSLATKRVEPGELSEDELEKVAGGRGCDHTLFIWF